MMTSSYIIASAAIQTPIYQLQVAIVGVRFFGISRGVFRYLERYISHEVTFRLLAKLRLWFFKSIEPLIPSKKKDLTSGDLLSRSIEDIESLEHIFVRVISPPFVFVAVSLLMFYLLNLFNLKYSLIFISVFYLSTIGIPALTFLLSNKLGKEIISLKTKLKEFAVDSVQGLAELIFYNQTENWRNKFYSLQEKLLSSERKMSLIQSLHEILTGLAMNFTVLVMLYAAIPEVNAGNLNGVYLSVITIGIMTSFEIVFQIPLAFQYLGKSVEAGERLLELTNENQIKDKKNICIDKKEFNSAIEMKNVSFSYDGKREVLHNFSIEIKKNDFIAITGASGSGKTTLVNLLTKLWYDYTGEITIDGIDYNNIPDENIRNLISVVTQNVHLFTGTIRENLLLAKIDATEEELFNALSKSDLISFVKNLSNGIDTNIGELGKKLSGGEAKRLAIARAILRNTPIIIFDEATSHLDQETESKILSMLEKLKGEKTIIFITHRTNNLQIFNNVIKINL